MNNIMVKNRSNELVPLDLRKIIKKTFKATYGIADQSELETEMRLQIFNGMATKDIQKTAIMTAVQKIDIDAPQWTFVASRLLIEDIYHRVALVLDSEKGEPYPHLQSYLTYGSKYRLNKTFWKKFSQKEIGDLNRHILKGIKDIEGDKYHERDYAFTYLGIKTWLDRYALKDEEGRVFELPQHMFMAVSMYLAQNEEDRLGWTLKFYDMLSKFEVMLATPTLSNARTERSQLSSCYVGAAPDNIEGIFETYKSMALLSKYGGGIGWDWNDIRAGGSDIDKNKGVGGGTIPFLKITNDIAIAVDQLGTRKGAIAVYLEPWHYDIIDFLDLKKNSGEERRRAHDLFPALWIPDLFMERVQQDAEWTLFDPYDTPDLHESFGEDFKKRYEAYEKDDSIRKNTMPAKELWKKILLSYFESASPFLTFKDTANERNQNSHTGVIRSSNLCLEIFQNTKPALYGIAIEVEGETIVFKEDEEVNISLGGKQYYTKAAKKVNASDTLYTSGGPIPIVFVSRIVIEEGETAVCNLASQNLSRVNTKEDMERVIPIAIRALDNVVDLNLYPIRTARDTNVSTRAIGMGVMGEAQMLAEHGVLFGSQDHFEKIDEIMDNFSYEVIKASSDLAKEKGSYPLFKGSNWSKGILPIDTANAEANKLVTRKHDTGRWNELRHHVKEHGMRNGYLMAIAPTSTISILTGTSQAIEPIYKRKWFEENLSGVIPVVAPNLSPATWEFYPNAYEVEQIDLIKAAAVRQRWIDQGQSLNVFVLLEKASGAYLNNLYMTAWKLGLKSTYYLRSESPEIDNDDIVDRSMECVGCQ